MDNIGPIRSRSLDAELERQSEIQSYQQSYNDYYGQQEYKEPVYQESDEEEALRQKFIAHMHDTDVKRSYKVCNQDKKPVSQLYEAWKRTHSDNEPMLDQVSDEELKVFKSLGITDETRIAELRQRFHKPIKD